MIFTICTASILFCILCPCSGSYCQQPPYPYPLFDRRECHIGDDILKSNVSDKTSSQSVGNISSPIPAESLVTQTTQPTPAAELATFDEWKQKILLTENASDQVNSVDKPSVLKHLKSEGSKKAPLNFASIDCGARIVSSNPEATNSHAVLTDSSDEYMNNPCSAPRKFVIIELCDSVAISEIELGNLELFSSLPKTYNISISERFSVKEERQLSSFKMTDFVASNGIVRPLMYAKFVKVEVLEHYLHEHYCPLTAIRVYGKGLLEDDDDDDDEPAPSAGDSATGPSVDGVENGKPPTNTLFGAAKKTVIQLFQQVLPPRASQNDSASVENVTLPDNISNETTSFSDALRKEQTKGVFDACSHCNTRLSGGSAGRRCQVSEGLCAYYRLANFPSKPQKDEISPIVPPPVKSDQTQPKLVPSTGATSASDGPSSTTEDKSHITTAQQQQPQKSEDSTTPCENNDTEIEPANVSVNTATIPTTPSSETAAKPLEANAGSNSNSAPSAEEVIVAGLFAPVSGLAESDDEPAVDANGELFPKGKMSAPASGTSGGRPVGETGGKLERRSPSLSASASSKQLLIRFVSRVRELEVNLTLTNRYLEELSSNYRKRLDDLKVKVEMLSNITATQAVEIERLTQLLNSTSRFYENVLLSSNQANVVYSAIPFMVLVIAVFCFFVIVFTCILRKSPKQSTNNSSNCFTQTARNTAVNSNFVGDIPLASSNVRSTGTFAFEHLNNSSPFVVNGDNIVASASASPSNGSIAGSSPSRQLSESTESPIIMETTPSNSMQANGNRQIWLLDSGVNSLNATPLVVPSTLSTSFLLSPVEKNKKHHKHHRHQHRTNSQHGSSNGTAKSLSPHRNSTEK